jgi:predicted restriction endonuclease
MNYWGGCAVVGCTASSVLRASHIKPWSKSSDQERLDAANGLLLTANLDALFNDGLITFEADGNMLVSDRLSHKDRTLCK